MIRSMMVVAVLSFYSLSFAEETVLKDQVEILNEQYKVQAEELRQLQIKTDTFLRQQANSIPQSNAQSASDTSIGGYGEFGYNRYSNDNSRSLADLKRFVILISHRFDDRLSINSEVEWEHAVTSSTDKGESEIEQAYLNYQLAQGLNLKAGLFLIPFGFLNENHEPPVFYGVERNEIETRIIPSTWREGGLSISGDTEFGLEWNMGVVTGFDVAKFDDASSPLHSIHQELQLAKANDPSFYGALNYRGIPGFVIGDAIFTGNSGQGNADHREDSTQPDLAGINARVTLWDLHTRFQKSGWDLQALYAHGYIGDASRIDQALQTFNTANASNRPFVPSEFYGWLLQSAYTVWQKGNLTLTPFLRFEQFNTQSKMPTGFIANSANADRVTTLGISFKPHLQVVIKLDYQKFLDNRSNDRFNIGLGYMF